MTDVVERSTVAVSEVNRLRLWLLLFFLALALPALVLVWQAYSELKWEAFHRHRVQAEELVSRVDKRYLQLMKTEELRPFTDFSFLNVLGDANSNFLQRSVLATYPVRSEIPGLIGYFQIDAEGIFSTPLLPAQQSEALTYGVTEGEYRQRLELSARIQTILSSNRLVPEVREITEQRQYSEPDDAAADSERRERRVASGSVNGYAGSRSGAAGLAAPPAKTEVQSQAAFDLLEKSTVISQKSKEQKRSGILGRVEDLKLDLKFQSGAGEKMAAEPELSPAVNEKHVRKERSQLPMSAAPLLRDRLGESYPQLSGVPVRTFESELDPYRLSLLDSGEFVLFRTVWRDGKRYIQGMLVAQQPFLQEVALAMFREGALSEMSDLLVAYNGDVLSVVNGAGRRSYFSGSGNFHGSLLYQKALSAPLNGVSLIFSITSLPSGAGGSVILWTSAVLLLVLCGGFLLIYRLGVGQIELVRQQQDFVAAVSHELKTPLTSIRMYGEMLLEGWVSEEKRQTYYRYIASEGERLSRLIGNVLQLARMNRNEQRIDLQPRSVSELLEELGPCITSQAEHAGFTLGLDCHPEAADLLILVDSDCLTQVVINLVDNAIKFSSRAKEKLIEVRCMLDPEGRVQLSVRDRGPGVARDQAKKIFRMFYRSESELTRETVGTGIGLALVHQLVLAMNARVDVINRNPGAEFQISFPVYEADTI